MLKPPDESVIRLVPARIAHHYFFLPLDRENDSLRVLITEPDDLELLDAIARELDTPIIGIRESEQAIRDGLKKFYGIGADTIEDMIGAESGPLSERAKQSEKDGDLADLATEASIVRFVNQILLVAYQDRATDIHIEPFEGHLRVRYRIDGVLHEAAVPPNIRQFQDAIITRLKIMADLNIAEKRMPQDGRIRLRAGSEHLDLRVSVLPIAHGESVNLRILRRHSLLLGLSDLGYGDDGLDALNEAMHRPHGISLVTGPTGSGKTTTLYACLSAVNRPETKILTVEDPVEYEMDGLCQMQVKPGIGFTFASGLRSMLRHDPDVILVGEIRDFETAELAVRAALTGHSVFSTLHTNDAPGAVTRLIDLGVEPFLVASSLVCVAAQRLVRKVCVDCRQSAPQPDGLLQQQLGVSDSEWQSADFMRGSGCEHCRGTGYRGRTAIYEIFSVDEELAELIIQRVSTAHLRRILLKKGMVPLRESGWRKIQKGITTPEEVLRVAQAE